LLSPRNLQVLHDIQAETQSVWSSVLGAPQKVALLDFPRHTNAGDTLIWNGEIRHLADLGHEIVYVSDVGRLNLDRLKRNLGDGTVLFHGGGNFGDLWPRFQDEREHVVQMMPNNRIIALPQSVYFQSEARAKTTNKIFSAHGGTTILARDAVSLLAAETLLGDVDTVFSHDGALGNDPIHELTPAREDILVLRRTDREATSMLSVIDERLPTADWKLEPALRLKWALNRLPGIFYPRVPHIAQRGLERLVDRSYPRYAQINALAATKILSQGRAIVTDRLHAHVWAILMGKPSVVVDNSYGKIRPIFEATLHRFDDAHFARDNAELEQAIGSVSQTLDRNRLSEKR
jgi:exopolysaccharide biosynthesis predicted pyruvyltransferase EpsI